MLLLLKLRKPRNVRLWVRVICLTTAVACFGDAGFVWFQRHRYQAEAAESFEQLSSIEQKFAVKSPPADDPAVAHTVAAKSNAIAKLESAKLHISGYVEDGWDGQVLSRAIGHLPRSAKPGEAGNVVLAAHRDTFFAGLRDAKVGDVLDLRAVGGKVVHYKISRILIVDPADAWVMKATPERDMLTLITCYPFHFVGSAPNRFVVRAEPMDESGTSARLLSVERK